MSDNLRKHSISVLLSTDLDRISRMMRNAWFGGSLGELREAYKQMEVLMERLDFVLIALTQYDQYEETESSQASGDNRTQFNEE